MRFRSNAASARFFIVTADIAHAGCVEEVRFRPEREEQMIELEG